MAPARRIGRPWVQRLAWLIGIWAASVGALALVAWLLRWVMQWVGLSR